MTAPELHIVSFDRPWPPSYGGIQDVHYRWKAWCKAGHHIRLHAFDYGRQVPAPLPDWAGEVQFYSRSGFLQSGWAKTPYIVASRKNQALWKALSQDESPIWLEGQHSTGWLPRLRQAFPHRKIVVRCHNQESNYYLGLAGNETQPVPKTYFRLEAWRLKQSENVMALASGLAVIRPGDVAYFKRYGRPILLHYPGHPWQVETNPESHQNYALYHGDLTVTENKAAVAWLLTLPWTEALPLCIAGRGAETLEKQNKNTAKAVRWLESPDDSSLAEWMRCCTLHVLPTNQNTGLKLKLLHALGTGRPVLCNPAMVEGTGLENFCLVVEPKEAWMKVLEEAKLGKLRAINTDALKIHPAFDGARFQEAWNWVEGLS